MGNNEKNVVRETILKEIEFLKNSSLEMMKQINESKTNTKKMYFKKKLRKNNNDLMQCLMILQSLPSSGNTATPVMKEELDTSVNPV